MAESNATPADPSRDPVKPILDYPRGVGGPKRMLSFRPLWPLVAGALTTVVVTGGGVLTMVGAVGTRTLGSTRSTRLEWESRQREIDDAIAAERPTTPTDTAADHENAEHT